jgi:protein-tyrosine phosphatase
VATTSAVGTVAASAAGAKTEAIPFTAATVTQTADGFDVKWAAPSSAGAAKVYAGTDPSAVGTDHPVGKGKSTDSSQVTGLTAAPRWYFELVPTRGGSLVVADRSLHLASAPNFRDAGGYRTTDGRWVKMGKLYRSDQLDKLTDADTATVEALGIKLVCDLRSAYERGKGADKEIAGATNEQFDVVGADSADLTKTLTEAVTSGSPEKQQELFGNGKAEQILIDGGRSLVSSASARAAYTAMFARLEDPAYLPGVFHCTAGKDRTGWAAAAMLTALGVPRSTVMADYLLSNDSLKAENDATLAQTKALIDPALLAPLLGVQKSYLDASFAEVKAKYGTFDKYLAKGIDVDARAKAKLQQELLAG